MARHIRGDPGAFTDLYLGSIRKVFGYLLASTGDRERAEDLAQLTYLKLHEGRHQWRPSMPVMPWLMTIARNTLIDDSRVLARSRVRLTASGDLPELLYFDNGPRAGHLRDAILRAFETLTPCQRDAFSMTQCGGLTARAAARALGTTETGIKLRIHRARRTLRDMLEPYLSN